jgi:hypothetical protein
MRLLASHPQIIAHEQYPMEFMPFVVSAVDDREAWLALHLRHYRRILGDEALYASIDAKNISQDHVDAVYRALAFEQGKRAVYFLEKFRSWIDLRPAVTIRSDTRTIMLMRDPRDILLSARAFDKKRGYPGFHNRPFNTDLDVVKFYKQRAYRSLANMNRRVDPVHRFIVLYENLALQPNAQLTSILGWLGLDASPAIVASCCNRAASLEDGTHTTTTSLASSVGRWQSEMSPELNSLFVIHFAALMRRFGYVSGAK